MIEFDMYKILLLKRAGIDDESDENGDFVNIEDMDIDDIRSLIVAINDMCINSSKMNKFKEHILGNIKEELDRRLNKKRDTA
jgi:hypothetical protein